METDIAELVARKSSGRGSACAISSTVERESQFGTSHAAAYGAPHRRLRWRHSCNLSSGSREDRPEAAEREEPVCTRHRLPPQSDIGSARRPRSFARSRGRRMGRHILELTHLLGKHDPGGTVAALIKPKARGFRRELVRGGHLHPVE